MFERRNAYLKRMQERMRERDYNSYDSRPRSRTYYDGRNPYGSEGGYVTSRRGRRDRESFPNDGNQYDSRRYDDRYGRDYNYRPDGYEYYRDNEQYDEYDRDYDSSDMEEKYKRDLEKWTKKLMEKDRLTISKTQIIKRAKDMNVNFEDYSEEEFYAAYLLVLSIFKDVTNDYNMYIKLAKQFLEVESEELRGADKLCAYYYEIVKGGKN